MNRRLSELVWDLQMIWDLLGILFRRGIFGENFGCIFFSFADLGNFIMRIQGV